MPVFTLTFCALMIILYIFDTILLIPKKVNVSLKERLLSGHNMGYLNHALRLSYSRIKKGEIWRLISSSLLHVGTFHIITNAAAMLIAGYAVESALGAVKTLFCFLGSALLSGLFMAFVYKLDEGEGASPGIFGLTAAFILLCVKKGTVTFSELPVFALIILALYFVGGFLSGKTTACEHISGFAGGLLVGIPLVLLD